jgi:hypothetical protein
VELLFRGRRDRAEQAVGLPVGTGRKVKCVGIRVPAAAQSERPQPIDSERLAFSISESTEEISVGIERVYLPIAEIANKNISAELAKGE